MPNMSDLRLRGLLWLPQEADLLRRTLRAARSARLQCYLLALPVGCVGPQRYPPPLTLLSHHLRGQAPLAEKFASLVCYLMVLPLGLSAPLLNLSASLSLLYHLASLHRWPALQKHVGGHTDAMAGGKALPSLSLLKQLQLQLGQDATRAPARPSKQPLAESTCAWLDPKCS